MDSSLTGFTIALVLTATRELGSQAIHFLVAANGVNCAPKVSVDVRVLSDGLRIFLVLSHRIDQLLHQLGTMRIPEFLRVNKPFHSTAIKLQERTKSGKDRKKKTFIDFPSPVEFIQLFAAVTGSSIRSKVNSPWRKSTRTPVSGPRLLLRISVASGF